MASIWAQQSPAKICIGAYLELPKGIEDGQPEDAGGPEGAADETFPFTIGVTEGGDAALGSLFNIRQS